MTIDFAGKIINLSHISFVEKGVLTGRMDKMGNPIPNKYYIEMRLHGVTEKIIETYADKSKRDLVFENLKHILGTLSIKLS